MTCCGGVKEARNSPTRLPVTCCGGVKEARDCPTMVPVTCCGGVKEARLGLSHHVASDLLWMWERGQARPGFFLFKGNPKQRSTTGPINKNRIKIEKNSQQFFW